MIDLEDLIETMTRRERALSTGSNHLPKDQKLHAGVRPDAESPLDRPELRWPSQRHLALAVCHHCGAGKANLFTDPPYGLRKSGETTCNLCSRVVVRWRADGTRTTGGMRHEHPSA